MKIESGDFVNLYDICTWDEGNPHEPIKWKAQVLQNFTEHQDVLHLKLLKKSLNGEEVEGFAKAHRKHCRLLVKNCPNCNGVGKECFVDRGVTVMDCEQCQGTGKVKLTYNSPDN